jgi:hypothetical protein
MNDMPDMSGAELGAGAAAAGGGEAPDLATAVKQLQDTIAGLGAQVEMVAEAAGLPAAGAEGAPAEEGTETMSEESAEPPAAPEAAAGEAGAPKEPSKGAFDSFLSKRPKAAM